MPHQWAHDVMLILKLGRHIVLNKILTLFQCHIPSVWPQNISPHSHTKITLCLII